jgi:hypothetical protein
MFTKVKKVIDNIREIKNSVLLGYTEIQIKELTLQKVRNRTLTNLKCIGFFLTAILVTFIFTAVFSYIYFVVAFYKSFIIWRGLHIAELDQFYKLIESFINEATALVEVFLNIPGLQSFINALFYPLLYLIKILSSLNLSQISLTCLGCISVSELFFNCLCIGVIIVFVESDYHLLLTVPMRMVYRSFEKVLGCRVFILLFLFYNYHHYYINILTGL